MKTPMQEVYENFNLMSDADFKAWMLNTDLLEKEKEVITSAYNQGKHDTEDIERGRTPNFLTVEDYYKETFNTKEI